MYVGRGVCSSVFYMLQYEQSCKQKSVYEHAVLLTRMLCLKDCLCCCLYAGAHMTITVASLCATRRSVGNVSRHYSGTIRLQSNDCMEP
jgi:hypothetical protein